MNVRRFAILIIGSLFLGILLYGARVSFFDTEASGTGLELPEQPGGLNEELTTVEKAVSAGWDVTVAVAGIIFLVMLLYGGVLYLTSLGQDDVTRRAKQILLDALIGIAIVVLVWPVGVAILNFFGLGKPFGARFRLPTIGSNSGEQVAPTPTNPGQTAVPTIIRLRNQPPGKTIRIIPLDGSTPTSVVTGADGQASANLSPGSYTITADGNQSTCQVSGGLQQAICDFESGANRVNHQLFLTSPQGAVTNATVTVETDTGAFVTRTFTDDTGHLTLNNLQPGTNLVAKVGEQIVCRLTVPLQDNAQTTCTVQ